MKEHSCARYVAEYIAIAFASYLLVSLVISIIGSYNYRHILCSEFQFAAILFIYLLLPIPRMMDMYEQDKALRS